MVKKILSLTGEEKEDFGWSNGGRAAIYGP